jgi:hypothetical protein
MVEEVILKHKSRAENFSDNHIVSKIKDRKYKIREKGNSDKSSAKPVVSIGDSIYVLNTCSS